MWLTLDIGNSAAKGGVFEGTLLKHTFRIPLRHAGTVHSWRTALMENLRGVAISRIGLASVVPGVSIQTRTALVRSTGITPEDIHVEMKLPFTLAYETPHTLGTDRLAAAVAAWTMHGLTDNHDPRCIVALDAGTAITYDVVDQFGVFRGGAIGAGPQLLNAALSKGTAQLPSVPTELPTTPIGRSTQEALQAGIMYAFLDGVQGLLARIGDTLEDAPFVVATGGWADFLHTHLNAIDHVEPHLVLHGIRILMALNGVANREASPPI